MGVALLLLFHSKTNVMCIQTIEELKFTLNTGEFQVEQLAKCPEPACGILKYMYVIIKYIDG